MNLSEMVRDSAAAVGDGNRDAVGPLFRIAMRGDERPIQRAGVFEDVPEQLTDTILHRGQAFRIVLKMQQGRDVSDDSGHVLSLHDLGDGKEPTCLFALGHRASTVVYAEMFEELHSRHVRRMGALIFDPDRVPIASAPGPPGSDHDESYWFDIQPVWMELEEGSPSCAPERRVGRKECPSSVNSRAVRDDKLRHDSSLPWLDVSAGEVREPPRSARTLCRASRATGRGRVRATRCSAHCYFQFPTQASPTSPLFGGEHTLPAPAASPAPWRRGTQSEPILPALHHCDGQRWALVPDRTKPRQGAR